MKKKNIFMLVLLFVIILFLRLTLVPNGIRFQELSSTDMLKKTSKEKRKEVFKALQLEETLKETSKKETPRTDMESEKPGTHVVLYYTSWWPDHGSEFCIFTLFTDLNYPLPPPPSPSRWYLGPGRGQLHVLPLPPQQLYVDSQ